MDRGFETANGDVAIEELADKVYGILKQAKAHGAANAVRQDRLARMAGTSPRRIQQATLELNRRGVPAFASCQAPHGVYLAATLEEYDAYAENLRSRLIGNAMRRGFVLRMRRKEVAARAMEPNGQRRLFA